ncbi:MAG: response regulator [Deltaproteobacteria bacterium]|nr:response regulator [Deltaproteobacteria bacterium]
MKKPVILIVDDNKVNIELLRAQLKPYNYEIDTALDGEEALAKITKDPPDMVLLDLMMPKISGYEVCRSIKKNKLTQFVPVIVITALQELDDKLKAIELGADDFLVKPFNKLELITRIKSLLRMKELHDDLDHSENILFSLVEALEAKDIYTRGHSERVAKYSVEIARKMGLTARDMEIIRKGGLLHDIGKIGVKEDILLKPGRLTDEEMEHVKSHPKRGFEICQPLKSLEESLTCIRSHHERYDGGGYPDGLKGDDIPLCGMILAVADTYDAMTTDRPYRKALAKETAVKILEDEINSGQWNPDIVRVFLQILKVS